MKVGNSVFQRLRLAMLQKTCEAAMFYQVFQNCPAGGKSKKPATITQFYFCSIWELMKKRNIIM